MQIGMIGLGRMGANRKQLEETLSVCSRLFENTAGLNPLAGAFIERRTRGW
jgi:6-phosphogluconate dehydrogenase (decarboxylating)